MSKKIKKLNIKEALKINEILDQKEKEEKENIPIYKKIYPPIKDIFIYDENNEINNNLLKIKTSIGKIQKKINFLMKDKEEGELDEDFLEDLIKNPCPISRTKVIELISEFIQKTKLMEKLESDYQSDKKIASNSLSNMCAEKLNYCEFKRGEIIFKIGESGENFYFILSGNVSVLKPRELSNIEMNFVQYIKYCMFLINNKEEYLLSETIKENELFVNLSSIEDIKSINKIIFMRILIDQINKSIFNNNRLKLFFQQNGQKYQDYDLIEEELESLEHQKNKGIQGAGKEWENYITKRCKLTIAEQVFFQSFEKLYLNNKPRKIKCFCYHPFLYLGSGLFFGDNALDFENNKRNATIRAEERTIVAYLKRDDYLNIISPKHKVEKMKELECLYYKFFFQGINSHIFEKNFFHFFSPREYYRGNILFSHGTIPRSLILLKSGLISLEMKGSVIDIHNLIKYIYNNIFMNPLFSKLSKANKSKYLPNYKLAIIKTYINDPILLKLKTHSNNFIQEMNTVKNYQIKILTKNETIGLEEIFLRLPYLMKSIVVSEKVCCYELAMEHIDKMLSTGGDVIASYIKFSMNKIISLLERLQKIKENSINMSLAKYEKYNGLKNITDKIDSNKINDKSNKKENLIENSRNKLNLNDDLTHKEKEVNFSSINNNKKKYSTIKSPSSSPIKLFMTNISPKSKSLFEKIKLNYKKLQNRQIKSKNNKTNNADNQISIMNNTINSKQSLNTLTNKNNNNTRNKAFSRTTNINTALSYDNTNLKEDLQTSYFNNINNISNSLTPKYTLSKFAIYKNEEKNQAEKDINEKGQTINKTFIKKNLIQRKNHPFNFSYVPLNLMCQNEKNNKNIPFASYINKLLVLNKRTIDFYNNIGVLNNNNNNDSNMNKTNRSHKIDISKRLKIINKKYEFKNVEKEYDVEKAINIINKKKLITSIIKDFYKDMKLNGYTSIIHNKEINTYFMRKYNKKYVSAEKSYNNDKIKSLKQSDSLPILI